MTSETLPREAEAKYRAWCTAFYFDPEATEVMIAYENGDAYPPNL